MKFRICLPCKIIHPHSSSFEPKNKRTAVFRDIFVGYELLAYLSIRATQLGYKACEIAVTQTYPKGEKIPTKISFFKGNSELLKILGKNFLGDYKPPPNDKDEMS